MSEDKDWFQGKTNEREPTEDQRVSAWVVVWAIVFAFVVVCLARPARAEPVFKVEAENGTIGLRLTEEPCTNAEVLTALVRLGAGSMLPRFKAAVLTWEGKEWASCWIDIEGVVYSFDEEGAPLQPIARSKFVEQTL